MPDAAIPKITDTARAAPRRVMLPPQPYDRVKVFGGLAVVVLVCAPVWLVGLGVGDVSKEREAETLLSSRETWRRQAQDPMEKAWLIPTLNDEPRYDPPPMTVWLNMLAWTGLDPATADDDLLVLRARLLAAALGVLTLLATYWAGMSIGDARVARLAAAALATTLLFVHQVRAASTDTHMLAWTTTAVAAGLWAMRPLKEVNWVGRRVLGWLVAGLALAAAVLTQGIKPAALFVLPPLIAAIALTQRRRIDNLLGLFFACTLGVVAASPWYLHVLQGHPEAEAALFGTALPPRELFVLSWSHWRLLVVLSPWTVWLIGALCQPFIRAEHERRRQLLIAWFWFLLLFVILSIPASRSPRYLAPLLPAAALLVGQLWAFHSQLASERQVDPGVDLLRVPHWLAMGLASIIGPLLLAMQPTLIERGYLQEPLLTGLQPVAIAALSVALLLIALLGARWHFKWKPRLAAYATVAWMIAALGVCLPAYERTEERTYHHRSAALLVAEALGDGPVVFLVAGPRDEPPDHAFLFYLGRSAPSVAPDRLDHLARQSPAPAIIAREDPDHEVLLRSAGFTAALEFRDGEQPRRLYRFIDLSGAVPR